MLQPKIPNLGFRVVHGEAHAELISFYNAADVLLLTSFHEGSNNSLKEAMACNLPIVSVDVGDSKERIREVDNCYVIRDYDPQNIANAVHQVILSERRSNGRDFISDFSLKETARKVIKVYNEALKR